ncbi:glutaredoxin [Tulasnella sp. 330]|nr:glutaredoxin [Tulasnella sp. 330]KAG8881153.1 glutaredoxin [Tulasnella sp. 331]KAG8886580.1 glutaredoxin [Tulasnella sp. 332]
MSTEVENLVDNAIKENKVVMFAKTTCGYCGQAKRLFNESYPDVKVQIFDLDKRDDGSAIQSYLRDKSKQSTVPNIFINQQHIGGNDKLQAAERNGTLAGLLAA